MHKAIVAKVERIIEIQGADNVQIALVLGEYCVVGKSVKVGDVGVLFPADLQLSEEYCYENNLHRDASLNKDQAKKGFFDKNRKVRAQKFLKVNSTAYFADLSSLSYAIDKNALTVGLQFNEFGDKEICKRFVSEKALRAKANQATTAKRADSVPQFLKHKDTNYIQHNFKKIENGDLLTFTAKLHGTSQRQGYLPVRQDLPKWKQWLNKIYPIFPEFEYEYVVGTRNVVLNSSDKIGYHGDEGFRFEHLEAMKPSLSKGMTVYGEVVGYANGKTIMPSHSISKLKDKDFSNKYGDEITYTYKVPEGESAFYIYRITTTSVDGSVVEWSQSQVESWCELNGFKVVPQVRRQVIFIDNPEWLLQEVELLTERSSVFTEDYIDPSHISEGIVVRVDGKSGATFYKSKSIPFKIMEGFLTVDDIETLS